MRLFSKRLSNVTIEEFKSLKKLTLKKSSMMKADVINAKTGLADIRILMIKNEKNKIVGWTSVLPSDIYYYQLRAKREKTKPTRFAKIYTFVEKKYRGQGIGKRLIKNAIKWALEQGYKPKVFAWNFISFKFFKSCNNLNLNVVNYSGYRR